MKHEWSSTLEGRLTLFLGQWQKYRYHSWFDIDKCPQPWTNRFAPLSKRLDIFVHATKDSQMCWSGVGDTSPSLSRIRLRRNAFLFHCSLYCCPRKLILWGTGIRSYFFTPFVQKRICFSRSVAKVSEYTHSASFILLWVFSPSSVAQ